FCDVLAYAATCLSWAADMMMISSVLVIMCIALCAGAEQYTYHTKYLDMPVDHFSFATNHTFKLRYLVNDTFFQEHTGSPIFFYTGNEGDIEMFAQNTGFMFDAAPEFGALLVFAEHRYYGKTLPFGNKSYDLNNVGYLTSQQALADFVVLIRHLQQNQDRPSPVIAFGGSYGGMLSAYLRMKYPNVVIGAIAASAPIFQFTGLIPCEAFNIASPRQTTGVRLQPVLPPSASPGRTSITCLAQTRAGSGSTRTGSCVSPSTNHQTLMS
ncbi:hypothetical protein L9F63_028324, partial [Diploptera punctata]